MADPYLSEAYESPSGTTGTSIVRTYQAHGFANVNLAILYARDATFSEIESEGKTLVRQPLRFKPTKDPEVWEIEIEYLDPNSENNQSEESGQEDAPFKVAFSVSAGSITVQKSKSTTVYPEGASDNGGFIGVEKGKVKGIEIFSPKFEFSVTKRMLLADIDLGYVNTLMQHTATVNDATWNGFSKGELLYLGAEGTSDSTGVYADVTHKFAGERNIYDFTIGEITVEKKEGWQYLEVVYDDEEDEENSKLIPVASAVLVHDVYDYSDFDGIGI